MFVQTAHGGFAGAFSACDDSDNRFANEYWNKGRYLPSYLQVTARIFFFSCPVWEGGNRTLGSCPYPSYSIWKPVEAPKLPVDLLIELQR